MTAFVDTSALLALLDAADAHHGAAVEAWTQLALQATTLVTTSYVVVETTAVVQHRLGMEAVRALTGDILPLLEVSYVDAEVHNAATAALLAAGRRRLSLVDCASFQIMRRLRVETAFAFDRHFAEQGFGSVAGA
ncbi:MAG: PIN domain-containing protein [Vicinamibacterales bacterium]|nr:PIN domain-containing protein [Vicinamibacterales bacterium]